MVATRRLANTFSSTSSGRCIVEKVPPEVLSDILVQAIPEGYGFCHSNRRIIPFLSVSRQWRRTAISTRGLWQRIDCSVPMFAQVPQELHMEMLDLWLQGCNSSPHHVSCHMSNERSQHAWQKVLPTMRHWRVLEYTCTTLEDYSFNLSETSHELFFRLPLTKMERLKLGTSANAGKIMAPFLQELSISRPQEADWNKLISTFPSIHALELEDSPGFVPSMKTYENIRELSCGSLDIDRAAKNDMFSSHMILRLPNCTQLRLNTCRLRPQCPLPQVTHLWIDRTLWMGSGPDDDWFGMFPNLQSLTLSRFADDMSRLLETLCDVRRPGVPKLTSFMLISSLVTPDAVVKFAIRRSPLQMAMLSASNDRRIVAACRVTIKDCHKPVSFSLQKENNLPDIENADHAVVRTVLAPLMTPKKTTKDTKAKLRVA
jgi:hypothetical protein